MLDGVLAPDSAHDLRIMVARLQEIDPIVTYHVDEPMFLRNTARPDIPTEIFEWFWFPNPAKWIAYDRFYQGQDAKSGTAIGLDPVA